MENGQGKRRPPPKRKENAADLRQMDLWTGGARPEPGPDAAVPHADKLSSISSQTDEIPKIDSKANRTRPAAAIQPKVKVTVSSGPRPGAGSAARSLPALTRRQHELLDYLRRRQENGELPPSLATICRDLGLVSRGAQHKQVVALVQAGVVEAMHGKQRGVRLAEAANDEGVVPLLGAIAELNERNYREKLREEYVFIGITEHLSDSIYSLAGLLGKPHLRVPRENVSSRSDEAAHRALSTGF